MKVRTAIRNTLALLMAFVLAISCATANATTRQSKRGISLDSSYGTGVAGGIEDQSWAILESTTEYHYVYAVQEGRYFASGTKKPNEPASTISDVGTFDMSNDDALGGPIPSHKTSNYGQKCFPSWFTGERCGRPLYKNYPTL